MGGYRWGGVPGRGKGGFETRPYIVPIRRNP
jgi:hypothetical protein